MIRAGQVPQRPTAGFTLIEVLVAMVVVAIGLLGLAKMQARRVPVCASIYAFILANLGFLGGLIQAARGHTITRYR